MPDFLDLGGLTVLDVGSWTLNAIFVLLIYRGLLVPRRTYDDKVHEVNEWRTESRLKDQTIATKDEINAEITKQNGELIDKLETVEAIFRALPGRPPGGVSDE